MTNLIRLLMIGLLSWPSGTFFAQEPTPPIRRASQPALAIGLLVDNSGSIRSYFSQAMNVGKGIVENTQPTDQIFLVRFVSANNIEIACDFNTKKSILISALDNMYLEGGLSAITDAIYVSANHFPNDDLNKRVIVLITDGAEESSYYRTDQLLSLLQEKHVRIYAVGFPHAVARQGPRKAERARKYLTTLAEETGGHAYFPATAADVKGVANSILNDIRGQ